MITVYGIPNCDTIKKTLDWLNKNKIKYEFHDYKKLRITKEKLIEWCEKVGWEILLNKKSTTWRALSAEIQKKITNQASAIKVMLKNNSIIKRPVIEAGNKVIVGFNADDYNKLLIVGQ